MARRPWLTRIFPPPAFLTRPAFGLDLSDRSAKFIKLEPGGGEQLKVGSFGALDIPAGAIVDGKMIKPEVVAAALAPIKKLIGSPWVIASLPEEETYVVELKDLPPLPPAELHSTIELQLEDYIPLPIEASTFDYELTKQPKTGSDSLRVSVLATTTVTAYTSALRQAGLRPLFLETEGRALARAYLAANDLTTTAATGPVDLLVDVGGTRTTFFILMLGRVVFSSTTKNINGQLLTEAVAKSTQLSLAEAEQYKINEGLKRLPAQQNPSEAIWPAITSLQEEITKLISYWENNQSSLPVKNILLVGGQASLPGLAAYLAASLNRLVTVGNPWQQVCQFENYIPPLPWREALRYGTAIGLALRSPNLTPL